MALLAQPKTGLQRTLNSSKLPACPSIMASLLRAINDPDSTASDLAHSISADQGLTVRVLRTINSAFYGLPRPVRSVEEAVFRLGFREISSLVLGLQMSDLYKVASELTVSGEALWRHCLLVAITGKRISKRTRIHKPEEIFTAGILHDIGKLMLFLHDTAAARGVYASGLRGSPLLEEERNALGFDHASLGGVMLRKWDIPEELARLVENHHNEQAMVSDKAVALLIAADALSYAVKRDKDGAQANVRIELNDDLLPAHAVTLLGLESTDLIILANESVQEFDEFVRTIA